MSQTCYPGLSGLLTAGLVPSLYHPKRIFIPKHDTNMHTKARRCADVFDHISTRQYARLVKELVGSIGLEPSAFGTHSLRRTKVAQIYKKTGNLRAVQLLLGHTKMDSTVRYLGVDLEDALSISEGVEV